MALHPSQQLTKPYGVLVTTGDKQVVKEFDTQQEVDDFVEQISKFTGVTYEKLVARPFGREGRLKSLAFVQIKLKDGSMTDKCVRVPFKRGHLFCTECHEYRVFKDLPNDYGATAVRCPVCTMSVNDFYIKTANGLWGTKDDEEEDSKSKKPVAAKKSNGGEDDLKGATDSD